MASKWIQKAIKKPGALRKSLGIKKGEKIPAKKLGAAAKKKGKIGQRAKPNTPNTCLLYTSPSPRDRTRSRMPSSA